MDAFSTSTAGERSIGIGGDVVQGYVHTGDVILQAIRALLPDFASRVENFLAAYLGSERYPVPFGGRDRELRELTEWLDDPAAPPYLLLTAPAGRGKSALVTHWLQQLAGASRSSLDIVFFPISVRARTNLAGVVFPSLAISLARLHGAEDALRSTLGTSSEHWRALMSGYLRSPPPGRHLLLILDGLDEAAGWELGHDLFPLQPPPGLRVVVSARLTATAPSAQDWLERLGWARLGLAQAVSLGRLNPAGLEQALRSMGAPLDTVADRDDLVRELHRLSRGDPFLVALYVDELWGRGASASNLEIRDLAGIRPGLDGYFRQWWDEQHLLWGDQAPLRESRVRTVLGLLASALGPLRTDDLLELVPEANLDSWSLAEALRPLARFVLGDGREQGFVLAHPLLADHFFNRLSPREQQQWEERFLAWGGSVLDRLNQGRFAPSEAPPYVVQYYGAHLDRAGAEHLRLAGLVSEGWWRAWEAVEGGFAGFLGDVDRAWSALRRENEARVTEGAPPERLGFELLCTLCHASATSLSQNLSSELVAALVAHRRWTVSQALAYVRQMHHPARRADVLELLITHVPEGHRRVVVAEAVATARQIGNEDERAHFLASIAPWATATLRPDVLAAAMQLHREEHRVRVAVALAPFLTEPEAVELAGWAERMRDFWERLRLTEAIAPRLPGEVRHALLSPLVTTARQILNDELQARILEPLIPHLCARLHDEAFGLAMQVRNAFRRNSLLGLLGPSLTEVQVAAVVQASDSIQDDGARVQLLATVVPYLQEPARTRILSDCVAVAMRISDNGRRVRAAVALLPQAPSTELASLVSMLVSQLPELRNEELQTEALHAITPYVHCQQATQLLKVASRISNPEQRARCLMVLAPFLPGSARGEVLREAGLIRREDLRLQVMAAMAPLLEDEEAAVLIGSICRVYDNHLRLRTLKSVVACVGDACRRRLLDQGRAELAKYGSSELLNVLLLHLGESECSEILRELLERARHIGDAADRATLLAGLFPKIGSDERAEFLAEVTHMEDASLRVRVLEVVAPSLRPKQAAEMLRVALHIADDRLKAQLMASLAGFLPVADRVGIVAAAEDVLHEQTRAELLERVAPLLPEGDRPMVATAARRMQDPVLRMRVLQHLAPHLPREKRDPVLAEAVIKDERLRARVVAALHPALGSRQRRDAVREAWAATGEDGVLVEDRAWALVALAPHLARLRLPRALSEAAALGDDLLAARGIEALVPHLRGQDLLQALKLARAMHNSALKVRLLTVILPTLPRPARASVIPAMLELDGEFRLALLEGMVPQLAPRDRMRALAAVASINDEAVRTRLVCVLVPHLPAAGRREAVAVAARTEREGPRAELLAVLTPHLSAPERRSVLAQAMQLTIGKWRVVVLCALLPHLDGAERTGFLSEALRVHEDASRARLLEALVPFLSESDLAQVLLLASEITSEDVRAGLLVRVIPWVPALHARRVMAEIGRIRDEWHRAQVLNTAISQYGATFTTEILRLIRQMGDPWYQVHALSRLVQHVEEPRRTKVLDEALKRATKVRHGHLAVRLLAFLMPHLAPKARTEILLLASQLDEGREHVLRTLVPAWAAAIGPAGRYALWKELLGRRQENDRREIWEGLPLLVALLDGSDPREFDGIAAAIRRTGSWWP